MKALRMFGIDQNGVEVGRIVDHWVLSGSGSVLGFLFGTGLYALDGTHVGWAEEEIMFTPIGEIVATLHESATLSQPVYFTKHSERPRVPILGPRSTKPDIGIQSHIALHQLFGLSPETQIAVNEVGIHPLSSHNVGRLKTIT